MSKEIWKPVVGFEGLYQVSNLGRIMSFHKTRGRILKPYQGGYRKGYLVITLVRDGMKKKELVHTLVLEAFVCKRPIGYQCNHINSNKQDNRLENLEWVTPKENSEHVIKNLGKRRDGESR